jgi:hypothetical protein
MPLAQANLLPDTCLVDGRYLAVKAQRIGIVSQLWHVRCDIQGVGILQFSDWQPAPANSVPPFSISSWVSDRPQRDVVWFAISENGAWKLNLRMAGGTMVSSSPVSQTYEIRTSQGGYHAVVWATFWTGQDAIDLRGSVLWSDPTVPQWSKSDVTVAIEVGDWPIVGEGLAIYNAAKTGFVRWGASRGQLYRGPLPHGVKVTFRGAILPQDDGRVPVTLEEQQAALLGDSRRALLDAASEGQLVGAAKWDQNWMAFGLVPSIPQRSDPAAVRAMLAQTGKLFDARPLATGDIHGGTAMQPPFGALKDAQALQGDPWRVLEMDYSADDYCRRGFHHKELDGRRVTKEIRPGVQTLAGTIEPKEGPDTFGKPRGAQPDGWDRIGSRSILADDQHRSDAYCFAAYALSGDPLLRECILNVMEVDRMRAMPARGWYDAPRATGRLCQSWAKGMVLFEGEIREKFVALALAELTDRERDQQTWNYSPLTVMQTIVDDRVISGQEAQVPWNNALGVMGFLECGYALLKIGRSAEAQRFFAFARKLGRSITQYSTVTETGSGHVLPIEGQKWFPGGAVPPPSYYTFPRAGAAASAGPGIDMLVDPNTNWWPWFAAALASAQLGPTDDVSAKGEQIMTAQSAGSTTAAPGYELEWWAVPR